MNNQNNFRYCAFISICFGYMGCKRLSSPYHLFFLFSILRYFCCSRSKDASFVNMTAGAHDEVILNCLLIEMFSYIGSSSSMIHSLLLSFCRLPIMWVTMKEHLFFQSRLVGKISIYPYEGGHCQSVIVKELLVSGCIRVCFESSFFHNRFLFSTFTFNNC